MRLAVVVLLLVRRAPASGPDVVTPFSCDSYDDDATYTQRYCAKYDAKHCAHQCVANSTCDLLCGAGNVSCAMGEAGTGCATPATTPGEAEAERVTAVEGEGPSEAKSG